MATEEKQVINGRVIPMEDYGALRTPTSDDRVNILDQDELDQEDDDAGITMRPTYDPQQDKGTYFRDGKRKIDFMLVYEVTTSGKKLFANNSTKSSEKHPKDKNFVLVYEDDMETLEQKKEGKIGKKLDPSKMTAKDRHEMWRQKFLKSLKKVGLEMEEETVEGNKKMIYYIKLHAPWDVLCFYAEDLCMRAPLQAHPNPSSNWSGRILATVKVPNIMAEEVPNKPLDYYTCQFKQSKIDRFLGSDNQDTYFNNKDRQRIVYEILATSTYGKRKRAEIGIERLLEEEVYTAAYPLHDGPYELPDHYVNRESLNPRQILFEYWARWSKWYKYQPLDHIKEYFGEKIGIYFAWLGFYTAWLFPTAIIGTLVFLYGAVTITTYEPASEVCSSGKQFKMCPLCDEDIGCQYWYLSDVCIFVKISYLFDQPGTVFFAVFVSFWAVTFLEYWKRKNASLAHHWDCLDFEEEEERPRPEYAARAPLMEKNPITGVKEPYFPKRERLPRLISGGAVILVMMVLVIIFIIAVIMYRVLVSIPLFQNTNLRSMASTMSSLSSAIVNLILIMALGKVYEKLALKLTQWEMHRTQSEYEDQLIFKVFIFQFVNFYSSIIYIGFFKGRFVGYPGHYTHFFGLRNEECQNGGCLIELAMQLGVIMIGKQMINNAQELFVPKIKAFIHHWKLGDVMKNQDKTRWEEDYELIDNEGLFDEYLEMVLQFGFITIFVAAFPLAPLFALLNNWLEIRLDAHKFVCETRRPVAERCQDIGVWFTILDALAQLAVISNAFLIAFTSDFLPRLMYKYEYNWDMKGYVNFTLAVSPKGTLNETCRYKDFRDPDGNPTMFYWQLLCVRLLFVIIFEHIVFGVCRLIDIMVPDVPESLEIKIKRERYLAKQALADTDTIMKQIMHEEKEAIEEEIARREEEEEEAEAAAATTSGTVTLAVPGKDQ